MTSLEQHLARHRHSLGVGQCACGKRDDDTLTTIAGVQAAHDAHVADTWREARTVHTVDELGALPNGSIYVSDAEGLAEQKAGDVWFAARCAQPFEPVLPGVVVHRPDEDGVL